MTVHELTHDRARDQEQHGGPKSSTGRGRQPAR